MPESSERVHIAALRAEEVPRVVELAQLIWRAHYPGIISTAQIEYMLAQRYNPEVVRAELGRDDVYWDVLYRGGMPAGFASYFLTGAPGEMKLDKLYVHPRYQRHGYGAMLLAQACDTSVARGCRRLVLAVNKHNNAAIAAYRKYGFAIEQEMVKDIGNGFIMDDYLMVRAL